MRVIFGILIAVVVLVGCGAQPPAVPVGQASTPPAPAQPTTTTVPAATTTIPPTATPPVPTLVPVASPSPTNVPPTPTIAAPTATPAITSAEHTITISEPAANAVIGSPVTVKGSTNFWPFEATLTGQIKDQAGNVLGIGPVMVSAPDIGQGGPFEAQLSFTPPAQQQAGTLELFEASAKDGSIVVIQTIPVQFGGASATDDVQIDAPTEGVAVTLPLHVAVRVRDPRDTLVARLTYADGVSFEQPLEIVAGSDGQGYAVANMAWNTEGGPLTTATGTATFEIARVNGNYRKRVTVRVLPENETRLVDVAWIDESGNPLVMKQAIGPGPQIASAALRELLNGPANGNLAGAITALPTYKEIVQYKGRTPDWGYEVRLIKLTIENGVATANFSKELRAYGGGSARVQQIRQQIEQTLKQFPSVQQVVIQIEGDPNALQP